MWTLTVRSDEEAARVYECKFTRYGATESGILGYQITVIQRHIQQIFQGSERL